MVEFIVEKRVWVDDDTFVILTNLFKITRGLIPRYKIYNAIFEEWINSDDKIKVGNKILDKYTFKNHCMWLQISEDLWKELIFCCSINGLDINIGFRIAVYNFIDLIDIIINNDYNNLVIYFFGGEMI